MRPIKWFDLQKNAIECNDFRKPKAFHFGAALKGIDIATETRKSSRNERDGESQRERERKNED